jgi:hypothetical protein
MKMKTSLVFLFFCLSCNKVPSLDPKEDTDDSTAATGDSDDSDTADEPAMIAGSYLVCIVEESQNAVGCRVTDKNKQKLSLSKNIDSEVIAYNPFNKVIDEVAVEDEAAGSEYHWYLKNAPTLFDISKVQANLTYIPTNVSKQLITTVQYKDGQDVDVPRRTEFVEGLHIGDWDDPMGEIADGNRCPGQTIGAISASGAEVRVPFRVSSENLGLTIELCDVGADSGTGFRLEKEDGTAVVEQEFEANDEVYALSSDGWGTGDFVLVFWAATSGGDQDYENYLVPRIEFVSDKDIIVSPVGTKVSSPWVTLTNRPSDPSRTTALNITVSPKSETDNLTHYKYKVGSASSIDCSNMLGYSALIPVSQKITDNISSVPDGNVELCVIGHDDSVNPADILEEFYSDIWKKDTKPPVATMPASISGNYINISGTDVEKYKYKVSTAPLNCADAAGYSLEVDASKDINVTTMGHQINIYVCAMGRDGAGNWQTPASVVQKTVFKNTTPPPPPPPPPAPPAL